MNKNGWSRVNWRASSRSVAGERLNVALRQILQSRKNHKSEMSEQPKSLTLGMHCGKGEYNTRHEWSWFGY